jgi:lipopolysaccharide export system permease protein
MTLGLYFSRRFLRECFRVFLVVLLLVYVIDMLDHVARYTGRGVSFIECMMLAAVRTPHIVGQALPLVIMLASLSFCVGLARSSEFVVTRAAGQSALKSISIPILCSMLVGIASTLAFEPGAARLDDQYRDIQRSVLGHAVKKSVALTDSGFWLRQKNDVGHTVINAKSSNTRGTFLSNVTVLNFDDAGLATTRIRANSAYLQDDEWIFSSIKEWDVSGDTVNPEQAAITKPFLRMKTNITPDQILEGYPQPDTVSLWELPRTIEVMETAGFSSLPHRIHFNMQIARPFLFAAMMIIGAVFTLQTARLGNLGVSVLMAIFFGFVLYFLQNLARTLGEAGEIPVIMASLAPPAAASLLAIGLFLHFEDG